MNVSVILNHVSKKLIAVADPSTCTGKHEGGCQDNKLFGWSVGGMVRHIFSVFLYDDAAIYSSKINVILISTVLSLFEKKL